MGVQCGMLQVYSMKVKLLVPQLFLTLSDPMDCSLPGSSVRRILQARILEWVAISFSKTRVVHKLVVCKQTQRTAKGGAKGA